MTKSLIGMAAVSSNYRLFQYPGDAGFQRVPLSVHSKSLEQTPPSRIVPSSAPRHEPVGVSRRRASNSATGIAPSQDAKDSGTSQAESRSAKVRHELEHESRLTRRRERGRTLLQATARQARLEIPRRPQPLIPPRPSPLIPPNE